MSNSNYNEEVGEIERKLLSYLGKNELIKANTLIASNDFIPEQKTRIWKALVLQQKSRVDEALAELNKNNFEKREQEETNAIETAILCDSGEYELAAQKSKQKMSNFKLKKLATNISTSASLYEELGKTKEAISYYRKALQTFYPLPETTLALSKLYIKNDKLQLAQEELENFLFVRSKNVDARVLLGIVFYELKDLQKAKEEWNKAYQQDPENTVCKAYANLCSHINNTFNKLEN